MKSVSDKAIILFDGVCNLCNTSVLFVLKHDKKKHFVFATLQSDVARELLLHYPKEIVEKDSILLIQNNRVYTESTAALLIAKEFSGIWVLLQFFWIVPKLIRDLIYQFIAKNRYRWFGKNDSCNVATNQIVLEKRARIKRVKNKGGIDKLTDLDAEKIIVQIKRNKEQIYTTEKEKFNKLKSVLTRKKLLKLYVAEKSFKKELFQRLQKQRRKRFKE